MNMYTQLAYLNTKYDDVHTTAENSIAFWRYLHKHLPDYSCILCYPLINTPTENFNHFWNWFSTEYSASQFTDIILLLFNYCRHYTQDNIPFEHFLKIVLSIRYTNLVDFNLIIPEIQKAYNLTNWFELNPFDTLYNHSKTAEEESSDSDSNLSELNLDTLFQTPPLSLVINLINNLIMATI